MGFCRHAYILLAGILLLGVPHPSLAQQQFEFDIPEQPLSAALLEFARVAGVSVGFESAVAVEKRSIPIEGRYAVEEALDQLLAGSGLTFTRYSSDVYRVYEAPAIVEQPDDETRDDDDGEALAATPPQARPAPGLRNRPMDELTVTGSRIRKTGFNEMMPVTVIDRTFIESAAFFTTGSLFGFVPSAGINSFNGIDNYFYGVNDARGDVSTANLRGLGSGNSLVLLNGRRVVNHPGTQAENQVLATTSNINALPLFAIERMEVLLDGASSVYGSDAVAGVINTVVVQDEDRVRFGIQHGVAESTAMDQTAANLQISKPLGERGSASLFAEWTHQAGFPAGDRRFSASSDMRPLFAGTGFANDRDVDNRSNSGSWGQFKLPAPVSAGGVPLTSAIGVFHVQPEGFEGCAAPLPGALCVDDGPLDQELRFDNNHYRFLAPNIDRVNLFSMFDFDLTESVELYGEAAWYEAESRHTREPANPLSSHPITIPRDNYWNPFGPLTFDDGRPNPNRLPGIDAPDEGLPIVINTRGLGGLYKVVDAGPRIIDVRNRSDRFLLGMRSSAGNWNIDGALLYSSGSTSDLTRNRVSSTLFQQSLARDTADAYNPFNGGDPETPGFGDANPNPDNVLQPFLIDIGRRNTTSLALADIYVTNSELFSLNDNPAAFSFGAEWREEKFSERRDPRLNGEIGYTDIVTGMTYASDVMQSSITPDSRGSRRVTSLFGELGLSLVEPRQRIALVHSIDVNVAMRLEDYSDIGKEWRPRLGLAWWVTPTFGIHGSWSEGLRAPNLPQINAAPVPRIQVARDWYRCQALINKGLVETLGACEIESNRAVEVITSGSDELVAETNQSFSTGLRFRSENRLLRASIDYWQIDQSDVVGLFGVQNHVALDYFRRLDGGDNPAVTRAPLTAEDLLLFAGSGLEPVGLLQSIDERYLNLDGRLTRGIDFQVTAEGLNSPLGAIMFEVRASRLLTSEQSVPELGNEIVDANEPAIPFVGAGDLLEMNGRPRWRAAFRIAVDGGSTHFGLFGRYVGEVVDTSAIQDQTDEFLRVDDWASFSAFAGLRVPVTRGVDATFRLTVNNIFNASPPLADESLGYFVGLHDAVGRSYNLSLVADFN